MKRSFIVSVALALASAAQAEPSPLGLWARGDGKARVRIERCNQNLCAVNTWVDPSADGEKAGDYLVLSVKPEGAAAYAGKAFDPQRQKTFDIHIQAGEASMTTRGCVFGFLCKDMQWTRIGAAH